MPRALRFDDIPVQAEGDESPTGFDSIPAPALKPDTPVPFEHLINKPELGPDVESLSRAKDEYLSGLRAAAEQLWPEGKLTDVDKLEAILDESGVGAGGIDQQLAAYRLAKRTGLPVADVLAELPRIAEAWDAASSPRAIPLAPPGRLPIQQPYKRRGQRFLEEQPDLAKALLRDPMAGFVLKAPEVNALTKGLRAAADFAFEAPVIGAHTMLPPEVAEEVRKQKAKERAEADAPQLVLQDEQSKAMQDGWFDPLGTGQILLPRRAAVPFLRAKETWASLQAAKAYDELANLETLGRDTQAKELEILQLEQQAVRRDYGEGSIEQIFTDAAEGTVSTAAAFSTVIEQPAETAAVAVPVGVATALVTKSPGAGVAAALKMGAGYGMWHLERGGAYKEMLNATKPDGSPAMDRQTARVASAIYATLAAPIETASWGPMFKAMGPLGALIAMGEKKAFTQALVASPGFMSIVKRMSKEALLMGVTEGGEEWLQDATQQAVEYFARAHAGGSFQGVPELNLEKSLVAFGKGMPGGMTMAIVGENVNLATQYLFRDKAVVDGNKLRELANLSKSPVAASAPKVLADMFEEHAAATGEAVTTVYVNAKEFARLFQEEGADPDAGARALLGPDGAAQLADAVASNGRLAVPVEQYIEKWVPSEAARRLLQHTATSELGLTSAEAKALPLDKMAQQLADKVLGADEQTATTQFDRLEQQLVNDGRFTPTQAAIFTAPLRALVRTAAASTGIPAAKLFERYSLTFGAGDEALSVTLGAPADSRYLTRAWQSMKPDERARALFIDTTTGALNRRAFNRAKARGRFFASISVEGIKYSNDKSGHDAGNAVYRAAARALAPHVDELYKPDGDFGLFVKDAAELAALLQKANESAELQGFRLTGGIGKSYLEARAANAETKKALEEAGERAPRGTRPQRAAAEFTGGGAKLQGTRISDELRAEYEKLDAADAFAEAFTDLETGLLNKDGFEASPERAFQLTMDFDGIKEMNELFGEEQVDRLIAEAGNKLRELGAHEFSGAHISGDEFQGKGDNQGALKAWASRVQDFMEKAEVPVTVSEANAQKHKLPGTELTLRGLPLSFGVGKTVDNAERELQRNKAERQRAGLRGEGATARRLVLRAEGAAEEQEAGRPAAGEDQRRDQVAAPSTPSAAAVAADQERADLGRDFGRQRFFDVGRLEQFPTPEENDEQQSVHRVLLDAVLEFGTVVPTQEAMIDGVRAQIGMLSKGLQELFLKGAMARGPVVSGSASVRESVPLKLFWTYEASGSTRYFSTFDEAAAYTRAHPIKRRPPPGSGRFGLLPHESQYEGVTSLNINWPAIQSNTYGIWNDLTADERTEINRLTVYAGDMRTDNARQLQRTGAERPFEANAPVTGATDFSGILGDKRKGKGPPKSKDLPGQAQKEAHLTGLAQLFRLEQFDPTERLEAGTDKGVPKGYTDVLRDGMERIFRIALNPNADLSTFHHETGHVFLELLSDLSELSDKEARRYREMFADTMKWLGIKEEDWHATSPDERIEKYRKQHEQFARGYEAYLWEGKAPSARLARVFERMKLWLRSVYRDIRNLNVALNDEIRSVYDRLLATDDELNRQARRQGTLAPMAQDLMGMTDEEYFAYSEAEQERLSHASLKADLQVLKDRLRENESWWKEEYQKAIEAARERYEELRARRAQLFLRGRSKDSAAAVPLDRRQVEQAVGTEAAKRFVLRKNGGENIDTIAAGFDYPTGKAMLEDVLALPEKAQWAKAEATEQMAEKYPGVLDDRVKLRELIGQGLHGEMTQKWLMKEWVALKRKVTPPGQPMWTAETAPIETLRLAARKVVDRTQLQRLNPGAVLAAERRAADDALKAAAKGDYGRAFLLKQEQLLNMFRWRYLVEAREQREKFLELAGELSKDKARARLGKAAPVYRDFVDALLGALQLKEVDPNAPAPSVEELIDQLDADAMTVGFDAAAIHEIQLAEGASYKQLTVAQLQHVDALLRTVRAAATGKNTALYGEKRMDLEELELQLLADSQAHGTPQAPPIPSSESGKTPWQSFRGWVVSLDGSLLRPEQMIRMYMGESWVRALVDPLQRAKQRELQLLKETIKPVVAAMEAIPQAVKNRLNESIDGKALFPGFRVSFDQNLLPPTKRHELLVMALNMGNESNLSRLLGGMGDTTLEHLHKALDLLSKEEMDWVQSVWDASESLWPLAAELEERDSGLRPQKLERRQLVTRHGTYAGGYFPAVYDWRVEAAGERQAGAELASILDPRYVRPATAQSHLKSRVDGFTGKLSLEAATVRRALQQAAHDIAYREAVKSVGTLLMRPALRAEMNKRMGYERQAQLLQWLKDTAQMRGLEGAVKTDAIVRLLRHMRAGKVIEVLGYSLRTAAGDLTNFVTAIPRSGLKLKHWGAAMLEYSQNPRAAMAESLSKSGELQARRQGVIRQLERQVRDLSKSGFWALRGMRWITDHAFAFLEATDAITSAPVWMGGYRQALAEGKSEAEAVRFADSMIRDNFPGEATVDLPAVLRDKAWVGQSLMFYRYFSVVYNSLRELAHPLATAEDPAEFARRLPRAAGRMLAFGSLALVLSELLSGRGPEDDEEWHDWYVRKLFFGGLSSIPLAGEAGAAIEGLLLGKQVNPRGNVLVGLFADMAKGIMALSSEDASAERKLQALMKTLAPVLHLPAGQALRTALGVAGQFGDDPARNLAELGSDVFYGRREEQPRNLLSITGEALEGSPR